MKKPVIKGVEEAIARSGLSAEEAEGLRKSLAIIDFSKSKPVHSLPKGAELNCTFCGKEIHKVGRSRREALTDPMTGESYYFLECYPCEETFCLPASN